MPDDNQRKFQTRMASAGFPPCPVTKKQFLELARMLKMTVESCDKSLVLSPIVFKPGSFGWNTATKQYFTLSDGTKTQVTLIVNAIVIGSKEMADWEDKLDNNSKKEKN